MGRIEHTNDPTTDDPVRNSDDSRALEIAERLLLSIFDAEAAPTMKTTQPDSDSPGDRVQVAWFKEAGPVRRTALLAEVKRLSTILGRELRPEVSLA